MTDYRKLFDLTGRTAVVLGAASGIGRASAEALADLGAHVLCADRDEAGARATAEGIGTAQGSAESLRTDCTSAPDLARLADAAQAGGRRIDIAVTTPGINIRKTILDYTEEDFDDVMNVNLKGTFLFMREFGGRMARQGAGSLIACSSIRASTIEPGLGVYGASKAGIGMLVKGFAAEVGDRGVRVNAIAPSIIDTALTAPLVRQPDIYRKFAAHTVLNRWGTSAEVASAVAFLAADASSYITGTTLLIDGGWMSIDGPPSGLTRTEPR